MVSGLLAMGGFLLASERALVNVFLLIAVNQSQAPEITDQIAQAVSQSKIIRRNSITRQ